MELRKGYKMTVAGVIPEDWKIAKFIDVFFYERTNWMGRIKAV
jgi:hypothetical protein